MIQNYLLVMLGGALGALLRYGVGQWSAGFRFLTMPVGTLSVNLLGCFLLGLLTALGERYSCIPRGALLMLTTGMCGAFTTFSTFTAESIRAVESGQIVAAAAYVAVSVVCGLLLFWTGKELASAF